MILIYPDRQIEVCPSLLNTPFKMSNFNSMNHKTHQYFQIVVLNPDFKRRIKDFKKRGKVGNWVKFPEEFLTLTPTPPTE